MEHEHEPICEGAVYRHVRGVITAAKYGGITADLRSLSRQASLAVCGLGGVHAVTWVPTHIHRWRRFGVDHAQVIGREVARWLGLPLVGTLRRMDHAQQVSRGLDERLQGPAFTPLSARTVPKRVLLVDDVVTTGATIHAARAALHAIGADWVPVLTCAHSVRRKETGGSVIYSKEMTYWR
ncbi:MAG: phosphoribosyltransferase family protein [Acidimicrobiia bacterium]